jgi:hypothetical protein
VGGAASPDGASSRCIAERDHVHEQRTIPKVADFSDKIMRPNSA